jgi:hypothetical protein
MTRDDREYFSTFASMNAPLPAEPFTADVVRRVRRRLWVRRAVLGAACAIGAPSAIGPVVQLWSQSEIGLRALLVQWHDVTWHSQYGLTMAFLSIGLAWPIFARWLSR